MNIRSTISMVSLLFAGSLSAMDAQQKINELKAHKAELERNQHICQQQIAGAEEFYNKVVAKRDDQQLKATSLENEILTDVAQYAKEKKNTSKSRNFRTLIIDKQKDLAVIKENLERHEENLQQAQNILEKNQKELDQINGAYTDAQQEIENLVKAQVPVQKDQTPEPNTNPGQNIPPAPEPNKNNTDGTNKDDKKLPQPDSGSTTSPAPSRVKKVVTAGAGVVVSAGVLYMMYKFFCEDTAENISPMGAHAPYKPKGIGAKLQRWWIATKCKMSGYFNN